MNFGSCSQSLEESLTFRSFPIAGSIYIFGTSTILIESSLLLLSSRLFFNRVLDVQEALSVPRRLGFLSLGEGESWGRLDCVEVDEY